MDSSSRRPGSSQSTLNVPNRQSDYEKKSVELVVEAETAVTTSDRDVEKQNVSVSVDSYTVDWDGDDDPMKPLNWSRRKKLINMGLISTLTLLTPFGSSVCAPVVPQMMEEFHSTNVDLASFIVSIYVLGYAFGPLVIAPLSEIYGRIPLYHVNTFLFIIFSLACALSTNLTMMIIFRFLAGVVGSSPVTIGSGTISDMFHQQERGKWMAVWLFPVVFGPALAPVIGSYLGAAAGWRWDFYFVVILTGIVFIPSLLLQRESYPPVLLERKAKALRKSTGDPNYHSILAKDITPSRLLRISLVRPTKMLFMSPIVFLLSLVVCICYSYLYLVFATITIVFENQYGFSTGASGLTFLGIGVGNVAGMIVFSRISDRMVKKMSKGGEMKPEYRLPPLLFGSFFMPVGLLWYGWSAQLHAHWIVPIIGTAFVSFGMVTVYMPVGTYLVDAYTEYASSATAAMTVLRSIGGGTLALAARKMYAALGLGWGNSLLAFIALAMIPPIWAIIKYGEKIRKHPRFQISL